MRQNAASGLIAMADAADGLRCRMSVDSTTCRARVRTSLGCSRQDPLRRVDRARPPALTPSSTATAAPPNGVPTILSTTGLPPPATGALAARNQAITRVADIDHRFERLAQHAVSPRLRHLDTARTT